jgi:superkiller protein 3
LVDALSLYLPDSAIYPTLSTLPAPDLTNPTDSTTASSQAAIYNSLPVLEEIVSLNEADETEMLDKEIDNRRKRLNAGSPRSVRNEVIREVYGNSKVYSTLYPLFALVFTYHYKLPYLYDEILNHPNTPDELRRQTESNQLRRKRDHLFSLPLDDPMKRQLAIEVEKLISGVVLLRIPDELAWSAFIDGQNCEVIGTAIPSSDCACPD